MSSLTVNFQIFCQYCNTILEADLTGLPQTELEFSKWWDRICLSGELRDRWEKRILNVTNESRGSKHAA